MDYKKRAVLVFASAVIVLAVALLIIRADRKSDHANLAKIDASAVHYAYFSQKDFYEQAYRTAHSAKGTTDDIKAVIVNHHLIGARLIAQGLERIATDSPLTVVLISPNHYSIGKTGVLASAAVWRTPYGELEPDLTAIQALEGEGLVSVEEGPFDQEQGISNLVAFVKRSLPHAKIIPLIIKDRVTVEQARGLAQKMGQIMPSNSRIIGSFDFSHYLTLPAADFHDLQSMETIKNFDFGSIDRLDMDSHPGLAVMLQLLADQGYKSFQLLENNNSARLANRSDILETTSYITGYFTKGKERESRSVTILNYGSFSGEQGAAAALDRNEKNFGFKFLERLFFGQDKTLGSLAGNDTKIRNQLTRYGYNGLNEGQNSCQVSLIRGLRIGICLFSTVTDKESIIQIQGAKSKADFTTVQVSEGSIPLNRKTLLARQYIDAGADAVLFIGSGDTGPLEIYHNRLIVYGQGDIISVTTLKNGIIGLAIGLSYQPGRIDARLLPLEIDSGHAKLLLPPASDIVLTDLAERSAVSLEIKQQIKQGQIILNQP